MKDTDTTTGTDSSTTIEFPAKDVPNGTKDATENNQSIAKDPRISDDKSKELKNDEIKQNDKNSIWQKDKEFDSTKDFKNEKSVGDRISAYNDFKIKRERYARENFDGDIQKMQKNIHEFAHSPFANSIRIVPHVSRDDSDKVIALLKKPIEKTIDKFVKPKILAEIIKEAMKETDLSLEADWRQEDTIAVEEAFQMHYEEYKKYKELSDKINATPINHLPDLIFRDPKQKYIVKP